MTDKTSEPQILGYKPKASEETTEEDNLRDLLNQDSVQKNPEPLGKFWFNLFKLFFCQSNLPGLLSAAFCKIITAPKSQMTCYNLFKPEFITILELRLFNGTLLY
jgi:hypothetical protein